VNTDQLISEMLRQATAIAFDGCHKIYIALDDEQARVFESYEYFLMDVEQDEAGRERAAKTLRDWYEDSSCGLRFISAVRTVAGDPNDGFVTVIEQGGRWS
jgi:hypothetical protein